MKQSVERLRDGRTIMVYDYSDEPPAPEAYTPPALKVVPLFTGKEKKK